MIRNGIYLATTRFLDGVEAYNRHVMVLRDGTMRGGGGYYYTVGSYTCSGGKWKGEMTSREHSPIDGTYPWARKEISIGFTGTYNDEGAEFDATALAGKRSFQIQINLPAAFRRLKQFRRAGRVRYGAERGSTFRELTVLGQPLQVDGTAVQVIQASETAASNQALRINQLPLPQRHFDLAKNPRQPVGPRLLAGRDPRSGPGGSRCRCSSARAPRHARGWCSRSRR